MGLARASIGGVVASVAFCLLGPVAHLTARADWHVAPTGSDSAPGTESRPFRTIQRAADALRPGDTCWIRGGLYREAVRLRTSGAEGKSIRLAAWPGETVTISGAEPVQARWTIHAGSIHKTRVDRPFSQLFVDGVEMTPARWPNMPFDRRWDKGVWAVAGEGSGLGRMVDPRLPATGIDWTGAVATLNVGAYQTFRRLVRQHGAGADSFSYDSPDRRYLVEQKRRWAGFDRYFLAGKLAALDSPGEWFLDANARMLYLWGPDSRSPDAHTVEGKVRPYGFAAKDVKFVELAGLHFFATALKLEATAACVVDGVHLTFPTCVRWPFGLVAPDDTYDAAEPKDWPARRWFGETSVATPALIAGTGNTVRDCSVRYAHGPGITLVGTNNTIENCLIHDIDWLGLDYGFGVDMLGSTFSTIRRCTVFNAGGSELVRLANHGASIVEYNHLHHGGLAQSDGAIVQAATPGIAGTTVRYNWVHDHDAFHWGGNGIRGDDRTRGLIVHHNVVWGCAHNGIVVKGDHNKVYNNTCLANPERDILAPRRSLPGKDDELKVQNAHTEAFNNCAAVISGRFLWERKDEPPLGAMECNYRGRGPMLVDPGRFDFRPRAGSPLIDAGRPIDGVTDGFKGKAPDIGAYEHGGERWLPGCRNGLWVAAAGADGLRASLCMPPTEPVRLSVTRAAARVGELTFSPADWTTPREVRIPPGSGSLLLTDEHLGAAEVDPSGLTDRARRVWFGRPMLPVKPRGPG